MLVVALGAAALAACAIPEPIPADSADAGPPHVGIDVPGGGIGDRTSKHVPEGRIDADTQAGGDSGWCAPGDGSVCPAPSDGGLTDGPAEGLPRTDGLPGDGLTGDGDGLTASDGLVPVDGSRSDGGPTKGD
jgi:hypothetical protein